MEKDSQIYKSNKKSFKRFLKSFKYSFSGLRYAFYHEKNLIIMIIMAIVAIIVGMILKISYTERLVIVLLIGFVMALELVNSAIEKVVDLYEKDQKTENGKIAKDCASGAVCVASIISLLVYIMIFLPKLIEILR